MSTIITYAIEKIAKENLKRIYTVKGPPEVEKIGFAFAPTIYQEEQVLISYKNECSRRLPKENALIFITQEQSEAMADYDEKEKHGE